MLLSPQSIPNGLTLLRILLIPLFVCAAYYLPYSWAGWVTAGLFTCASITDFLDGLLARRLQAESAFGACLDPIADKLMVTTALLVLLHQHTAPFWPILLIILREILVSGLREYLSKRHISLPVTQLAKWKTTVQMVAIIMLLLSQQSVAQNLLQDAGHVMLWLAMAFTLVTGYSYIRHAITQLGEPS